VLRFIRGTIRRSHLAMGVAHAQQDAHAEQAGGQQHKVQDGDRARRLLEPGHKERHHCRKRRDQDAGLDQLESVPDRIETRNRRAGLKPLEHDERREKRDAAIQGDAQRPLDGAVA
jgi:hypothetical protein